MLGLWRAWCAALDEANGHSAERRRIERGLVARLGYPRVLVERGGGRPDVFASDERGIARAVGSGPETEDLRGRLMAELAARREGWNAEAERLGLDAAERREDEAWKRVDALAVAVERTAARSVGGVVAKLAVAVALREQSGAGEDEFPWPLVGGALEDLRAVAGA